MLFFSVLELNRNSFLFPNIGLTWCKLNIWLSGSFYSFNTINVKREIFQFRSIIKKRWAVWTNSQLLFACFYKSTGWNLRSFSYFRCYYFIFLISENLVLFLLYRWVAEMFSVKFTFQYLTKYKNHIY